MDTRWTVRVRRATRRDRRPFARALRQEHYFVDRLHRQRLGTGLLLIAWLNGCPVGDVFLKFEEHDEPLLRERLPGVPVVTHLEVRPHLRGNGIGTHLLRRGEAELIRLGHRRVTLGVEPGNRSAIRLYEWHGYRRFPDEHTVIDTLGEAWGPDGTCRPVQERCFVFVKNLASVSR